MGIFDPEFQDQNIEGKIVAALERISEAFRVLKWEAAKKASLSPIQLQVLLFIRFHQESQCSVSYLAKEFNMTKATMSDVVKTLRNKELITRKRLTSDNRSYVLSLTSVGEDKAKELDAFADVMHEPLHRMGEEEKERLLRDLVGILHRLVSAGVINIQRMCPTCHFHKENKDGTSYCKLLEMTLPDPRLDCDVYKGREKEPST